MKLHVLMQAFQQRCVYCGRSMAIGPVADPGLTPTVDHDIPRCRKGAPGTRNQVLACQRCNSIKSDMTGEEFIEFRRTLKFAASYIAWLEQQRARKLF